LIAEESPHAFNKAGSSGGLDCAEGAQTALAGNGGVTACAAFCLRIEGWFSPMALLVSGLARRGSL
jgi:hypothetical protein